MLNTLAIHGYRSLRELAVPLQSLNLVTGPNGSGLLVLNEPETSLHPDLLPALARLIAHAARASQVIVVSHAPSLIDALQQLPECHSITLTKRLGESVVVEDDRTAPWHWPAR